jgi:3-oxosteroid 1-dehydrogenase
MGINEPVGADQTFDVIVVGSGAGGMTAALCSQDNGLSALVIEKQNLYGGTTAVSGGGIWIPCNDDIPKVGGTDSPEEALTYLNIITGGEVPPRRLETYVRNAVLMVRHMAQFGVKFKAVKKYPDYFPDKPGGKPGYRTMEPLDFDASTLGAEHERLRRQYPGTLLMARISMDQVEAHTLFTRGPGWILLTLRMMCRYWFDFAWRRRSSRDRRMVLGQALAGSLRKAMLDRKVPLWLETAFESLITENGRVVGVNAVRNGQRLRLIARHGVVLASGGFESNQQMREQYLPKPTSTAWTAAPPINHGDGIRAGQALGAATAFMHLTWGSPTVVIPGTKPASGIFVERGLPGCVVVNKQGRRFVNEACPYTEFVYAMYAEHAKSGGGVPCWMVFDATFRKKYPMGPMLPGQIQPDSKLPKDWLDKVYYRADTLDALAAKIGVDAANLKDTVRQMGEFAAQGKDPQFGKGENVFDRYYSDPSVKPNSCLGPIEKAPFYAVRLDPGELGTKGGLLTDENARVLREDGSSIDGLYAIGNCSAAVMGRTYAGPGATLGPAMTFGYLAAQDIAGKAGQRKAQAGVAAAA